MSLFGHLPELHLLRNQAPGRPLQNLDPSLDDLRDRYEPRAETSVLYLCGYPAVQLNCTGFEIEILRNLSTGSVHYSNLSEACKGFPQSKGYLERRCDRLSYRQPGDP